MLVVFLLMGATADAFSYQRHDREARKQGFFAARLAWSRNLSAELSALYDRPGASTFQRIHQREHDPHLRWDHMRYDMLGPVGPPCATPLEVYGNGDGEKHACGLSAAPNCIVISIGNNGEWEFEKSVVERTECHVHVFDCTVPKSTQPPRALRTRVTFHHLCIGATSREEPNVGEFASWPDLLARSGLSVAPTFLKV